MKTQVIRLSFFLIAALLPAAAPAQTDTAGLMERLRAFRFGGDRATPDAVAQWARESRATPQRRREAARALAGVLQSDAAFDAKQLACRELVLLADAEQIPALTGLLADDALAHYALMVLAKIPGEAASAVLRREMGLSRGAARAGLVAALGERRDPQAVPLLVPLLRASDPALSDAAAWSLGRIGGPRAAQALRQAFAQTSGARRMTAGIAMLDCAAGLRQAGDAAGAWALYGLLDRAPDARLRAAALRESARAEGVKALPRVLEALGEDGTPRQTVALGLARDLPGRAVTGQMAARLPKLSPKGRLLLLAALADRGDPAAAPAVRTLCSASDGATREAALRALGTLGDASVVPTLLQATASGATAERAAARASLARLRGRDVDARLLAAAEQGAPALRAAAVEGLGQRQTAAAVPRLVRMVRGAPPAVSAAVVRVLREMGRPADVPALLDLMLATPAGERDEVMSAVSGIARRGATEEERTGAILTRFAAAAKPADRADLLGLLAETGGPGALAALREAVADPSPEVQASAVRLLGEWPTDEPRADLLRVVGATSDERLRTVALRGAIRLIGANEGRSPQEALALYKEAVALSRTPDEKRLALAGLAKAPSRGALEYAAGFLKDDALKAEAEFAVVEIGRGTAGTWREETRAALEPIASGSTDENARTRARAVLAMLDRFGDFVTSWEASPAYRQDGANCAQLFDMPFAPEEAGQPVAWRAMPAGTAPEQPWLLDLLALHGGEQRVAYLRTAVWSEMARDLVLELGSDDGVKVWWNGPVVHAVNVQRAVAPGQEKVKVSVKPGWNALMLKVTQNVMGWGACARFTNPDGSPAAGLRFALPSEVAGGESGGR